MANPYATVEQFCTLYDVRVVAQLSNDNNSRTLNQSNVQFLLDLMASRFESVVNDRWILSSVQALNPMPLAITLYVLMATAGRIWGRRTDGPKKALQDGQEAQQWLDDLATSKVSLPGIEPSTQPVLQASDFKNGISRYDWVFGTRPSPTGPSGVSGGFGNAGNPNSAP